MLRLKKHFKIIQTFTDRRNAVINWHNNYYNRN